MTVTLKDSIVPHDKMLAVKLGARVYNYMVGDMIVCDSDSKVFGIWGSECSSIIDNVMKRPIGNYSDTLFGFKLKQIKL